MNMYFRLILQIILSKFSKPMGVNDIDRVNLRVLPNDLDINIHMNNGRFISIMDLGRTRFSIRSGLYAMAAKMGWGYGVVGGSTITYFKSLAPFQKYTLTTKLAGHFNGWFFIEQRFESKGKLVAAGLVKVTFLTNGRRVPAHEVITAMNVDDIGDNKEYLEHLFNSEAEFLRHVKKDYT
jgi:acyl-CoA thioesterase FadM